MIKAFYHKPDGFIASANSNRDDAKDIHIGETVVIEHTNSAGVKDLFEYKVVDIEHLIDTKFCIPSKTVYILKLRKK